jgi:hypothetical protein
MITVRKSKYEPRTKIAIGFGKTVRHINYKEAKYIHVRLGRMLCNRMATSR